MPYPFRLGATSYVYPDALVPNVRHLAPLVDDIELVLFEVDDGGTNLPDAGTVGELRALAAAHDLTFTVHLPLDLPFGVPAALDKVRRAIAATRPLDPFGYVLHLDGRLLGLEPRTREIVRLWQRRARQALEHIIPLVGDRRRLCVENVEGWDPAYLHAVVIAADTSRCIDIGHLWLQGVDPLPHLRAYLGRTRVIHLHGVGSRDHQSLAHVPSDELRRVVATLRQAGYAGVVTLEVFSVKDFFASREILLAVVEDAGGPDNG